MKPAAAQQRGPLEALEILGITVRTGATSGTPLEFVELSRIGLKKHSLRKLCQFLGFSTADLAEILPISERTIQRQKSGMPFNPAVSEQLLDIAKVAEKGLATFGDKDRFLSWLDRPSLALGNQVPRKLLATRFGIDLVSDELGRIEHGVIS